MKKKDIESWIQTLGFDHVQNSGREHIDDRQYKFSLYILNQDTHAIRIRRGAIQELVIEDDIIDWYHKGYVTFLNPEDVFEKADTIYAGNKMTDPLVPLRPYRIRGDCRDLIYLIFEPMVDVPSDEKTAPLGDLNHPTYTMKFLFTIYASEKIQVPEGVKGKLQKLYFHDYRYQMLREKNIYYSTGKKYSPPVASGNVKDQPITQVNNDSRAKLTGEIVQDILSKALLTNDTESLFSYHWDFGESQLMYTSPANNKAIDDLNYVLDKHVSSKAYDNQPCIFRLERFTERWELLPLTEYFRRSTTNGGPGPLQTEHFLLASTSEVGEKIIPPVSKTFGMGIHSPAINYHFPDLSVINDYTFSEISGVDCQEILNSLIIHRKSIGGKQFNIDIKEHNIETVHDAFQEKLIDHTYGGDQGHGHTSWLTDTSRATNYNMSIVSSWSSDDIESYAYGRNRTLLGAFLLGNTIQFNIRGEPSRRAGVWIAVDKNTNYTDNEYEMKVLGQYFTTRVIHKFGDDGYTNNVIGVKPYFYKQLQFDTDDLLYKDIENG